MVRIANSCSGPSPAAGEVQKMRASSHCIYRRLAASLCPSHPSWQRIPCLLVVRKSLVCGMFIFVPDCVERTCAHFESTEPVVYPCHSMPWFQDAHKYNSALHFAQDASSCHILMYCKEHTNTHRLDSSYRFMDDTMIHDDAADDTHTYVCLWYIERCWKNLQYFWFLCNLNHVEVSASECGKWTWGKYLHATWIV